MRKTTTEKRASVEEQIKQLENQHKQLVKKEHEEERAKRTSRLCKRGGAIEKLFPELVTFADEQFDVFVKKVLLTDYSKRVIAELQAQKPAPKVEPKPAEASKDGG